MFVLRCAVILLVINCLLSCDKHGFVQNDPSASTSHFVPSPGSTFDFERYDEDELGTKIAEGMDTVRYTILDTGLIFCGRSSVVKVLAPKGDTIHMSYFQGEIALSVSPSLFFTWPGWLILPQVTMSYVSFKNATSFATNAWWYSPDIGFLVRMNVSNKRTMSLIRYNLK
jgi:hypothetical protein